MLFATGTAAMLRIAMTRIAHQFGRTRGDYHVHLFGSTYRLRRFRSRSCFSFFLAAAELFTAAFMLG